MPRPQFRSRFRRRQRKSPVAASRRREKEKGRRRGGCPASPSGRCTISARRERGRTDRTEKELRHLLVGQEARLEQRDAATAQLREECPGPSGTHPYTSRSAHARYVDLNPLCAIRLSWLACRRR